MEYYADHWEEGIYHCAECGAPLFSSKEKFKAKSECPSFKKALPKSVRLQPDASGGEQAEVICAACENSLGHVFEDDRGDDDTHHYCILSEKLEFEEGESEDE